MALALGEAGQQNAPLGRANNDSHPLNFNFAGVKDTRLLESVEPVGAVDESGKQ